MTKIDSEIANLGVFNTKEFRYVDNPAESKLAGVQSV
jgi:hypothetical protein